MYIYHWKGEGRCADNGYPHHILFGWYNPSRPPHRDNPALHYIRDQNRRMYRWNKQTGLYHNDWLDNFVHLPHRDNQILHRKPVFKKNTITNPFF